MRGNLITWLVVVEDLVATPALILAAGNIWNENVTSTAVPWGPENTPGRTQGVLPGALPAWRFPYGARGQGCLCHCPAGSGVDPGPNCFLTVSLPIGRPRGWNRKPQPPPSRQECSGWRADQPFIHEHSVARLQDFLCLSPSRGPPRHSKLRRFAFWLLVAWAGVDWTIDPARLPHLDTAMAQNW